MAAERLVRTLTTMANACLAGSGLSDEFWADACAYVTFVHNRLPRKELEWKTPFEILLKRSTLTIERLPIFGEHCVVHNHTAPTKKLPKFTPTGMEGRFIGWTDDRKMKIYVEFGDDWKILEARPVYFMKKEMRERQTNVLIDLEVPIQGEIDLPIAIELEPEPESEPVLLPDVIVSEEQEEDIIESEEQEEPKLLEKLGNERLIDSDTSVTDEEDNMTNGKYLRMTRSMTKRLRDDDEQSDYDDIKRQILFINGITGIVHFIHFSILASFFSSSFFFSLFKATCFNTFSHVSRIFFSRIFDGIFNHLINLNTPLR